MRDIVIHSFIHLMKLWALSVCQPPAELPDPILSEPLTPLAREPVGDPWRN